MKHSTFVFQASIPTVIPAESVRKARQKAGSQGNVSARGFWSPGLASDLARDDKRGRH